MNMITWTQVNKQAHWCKLQLGVISHSLQAFQTSETRPHPNPSRALSPNHHRSCRPVIIIDVLGEFTFQGMLLHNFTITASASAYSNENRPNIDTSLWPPLPISLSYVRECNKQLLRKAHQKQVLTPRQLYGVSCERQGSLDDDSASFSRLPLVLWPCSWARTQPCWGFAPGMVHRLSHMCHPHQPWSTRPCWRRKSWWALPWWVGHEGSMLYLPELKAQSMFTRIAYSVRVYCYSAREFYFSRACKPTHVLLHSVKLPNMFS